MIQTLSGRKGVPTEVFCPHCHWYPESIYHAVWGCRKLFQVRDNYSFARGLQLLEDLHFHEFMRICLRNLNSENLELLCVILWRIWHYRNQVVHKLVEQDVVIIVSWACDFLSERRGIHYVTKSNSKGCVAVPCSWKPLDVGYFKINTDVATGYKNHLIGWGIINRDESGQVKAIVAYKMMVMLPPIIAEAIAVKRGVNGKLSLR
ncbi:hypothetical protein QYF36_017271 [Acer negundo]|nr:hypothetical protein QYF36_017271 [Acer negundo]